MLVCHKCDNPACVNPEHLFLGTHKDNMRDMVEKGSSARGSRHNSAKLTEKEVFQIKALLSETQLTQERIAMLFGVSGRTISHIKQDDLWKHVIYTFSNNKNSNSNSKSNGKKSLEWKQLSLFE